MMNITGICISLLTTNSVWLIAQGYLTHFVIPHLMPVKASKGGPAPHSGQQSTCAMGTQIWRRC